MPQVTTTAENSVTPHMFAFASCMPKMLRLNQHAKLHLNMSSTWNEPMQLLMRECCCLQGPSIRAAKAGICHLLYGNCLQQGLHVSTRANKYACKMIHRASNIHLWPIGACLLLIQIWLGLACAGLAWPSLAWHAQAKSGFAWQTLYGWRKPIMDVFH